MEAFGCHVKDHPHRTISQGLIVIHVVKSQMIYESNHTSNDISGSSAGHGGRYSAARHSEGTKDRRGWCGGRHKGFGVLFNCGRRRGAEDGASGERADGRGREVMERFYR